MCAEFPHSQPPGPLRRGTLYSEFHMLLHTYTKLQQIKREQSSCLANSIIPLLPYPIITPMNAKHLFAILFLLCTSFSILTAQTDFRNFPLDSFKLPDIDRSALLFSGSIFGNYTNVDRSPNNRLLDARFSPRVDFDYSRYINRRNLQANSSASLDQDIAFSNRQNPSFGLDYKTAYDSRLQVSTSRRIYNGKTFHEIGGSVFNDYSFLTTHNDQKERNSFGYVRGTIGLGNGRLEPVSDVAMAMFILSDAIDLGLDGSSITTENIYEFASLMAHARNRRIFDTRRHRIQELRDMYAFMEIQGWVIPNDPGFFTVLTDNLFYNPFAFRLTGSRWRYLLSPELGFRNDRFSSVTQQDIQEKTVSLGGTATIEYARYKPVSVFKDNIRLHSLSAGVFKNQETQANFEDNNTLLEVDFNNSIGRSWYPNNRTTISVTASAGASYYRYLESPAFTFRSDQLYLTTGIGAQCSYFLSYRARLVADAVLRYVNDSGGIVPHSIGNISSSMGSDGIHARLNATLLVDIF